MDNLYENVTLTPIEIDAIEIFFKMGVVYTSSLQRNLEMGFGSASRIIDSLEEKHIVSQSTGEKKRKLLITREEFELLKNKTK